MELPGRLVLLGHPVEHSLSPAFQNAALRAAFEDFDALCNAEFDRLVVARFEMQRRVIFECSPVAAEQALVVMNDE